MAKSLPNSSGASSQFSTASAFLRSPFFQARTLQSQARPSACSLVCVLEQARTSLAERVPLNFFSTSERKARTPGCIVFLHRNWGW